MLGAAGWLRRESRISDRLSWGHKLEDVVPKRIGRWDFVTSSGLVIRPRSAPLAVYSQLLTRVYLDGKAPIWLLIAYSAEQTGFLQVHRPEFCYTAAGYRLSDFATHRSR